MRKLSHLPAAARRICAPVCMSLGDRSFRHQAECPDSSPNSAGLLTVRSGVNRDESALYRGPSLTRPLAPPQPRLSQPLESRLVAVQFRHGDLTLQDSACSGAPRIGGDEARRLCTLAQHAHHSGLLRCHECTETAVSRHNGVSTLGQPWGNSRESAPRGQGGPSGQRPVCGVGGATHAPSRASLAAGGPSSRQSDRPARRRAARSTVRTGKARLRLLPSGRRVRGAHALASGMRRGTVAAMARAAGGSGRPALHSASECVTRVYGPTPRHRGVSSVFRLPT